MNWRWILVLPVILTGLSGCWLDEAPAPQHKSLSIVADFLSGEDSLVIDQFAGKYHVDVKLEILQPQAILQRIRSDRYNADVDILITEDASLRRDLQELNALKAIRNTDLFSRLERQFNNQHHHWIPVSHDPLIVTRAKDTSSNCPDIDFRSWHRNDSLQPALLVTKNRAAYLAMLQESPHLNWINPRSGSRKISQEQVYALSEFVEIENRTDSLYHANAHRCRYYVVDNQRYISRMNTASVYRYGRNSAIAEHFLAFFTANSYSIANGRNQLPTRKNGTANWYIRSLSIQ